MGHRLGGLNRFLAERAYLGFGATSRPTKSEIRFGRGSSWPSFALVSNGPPRFRETIPHVLTGKGKRSAHSLLRSLAGRLIFDCSSSCAAAVRSSQSDWAFLGLFLAEKPYAMGDYRIGQSCPRLNGLLPGRGRSGANPRAEDDLLIYLPIFVLHQSFPLGRDFSKRGRWLSRPELQSLAPQAS